MSSLKLDHLPMDLPPNTRGIEASTYEHSVHNSEAVFIRISSIASDRKSRVKLD